MLARVSALVPRLLSIGAACLIAGCESLAYYGQSVQGHFDLLGQRQPIVEILQDHHTDPELAARLRTVVEIRDFASEALGLPDNASYRSYADVGRDVLLWNLVAAPELSLAPRQWCYPVIGCAAYRGYFASDEAHRHADRLRAEGFDVAVLNVPAYSSLGWFDDPLPSTVIAWPIYDLAGLIFHELAHQTVYATDDSAFNESYASLVEEVGIKRWLSVRGDTALLAEWRQRQQARATFLALIRATRGELQQIFASSAGTAEKRTAKAAVLTDLQSRIRDLAAKDPAFRRYRSWGSGELNNAHLVVVDTYHRWFDALHRLLQQYNGDLMAFHGACRKLAALDGERRREKLCELVPCTPDMSPSNSSRTAQ